MTRIIVAISFALVLGLPFVFRPERAEIPAGARTLVIITPHHEQIRAEFERGFSEWHEAHFDEPVVIDWRQPGGTSEIRKQLRAQYAAALTTGRIAPDGAWKPLTDRAVTSSPRPCGSRCWSASCSSPRACAGDSGGCSSGVP